MEPKEPGYTFLVVPDSGEGEVRQYTMSRRRLRKWATVVSVVAGILLCSLLLLVFNLGRLRSYDAVVDENLSLRETLGRMRNIITRSLGFQEEVEIDTQVHAIQKGDRYLLCSDGLSGLVKGDEIGDHVRDFGPQDAARKLVHLACERGGDDNITTVVLRIDEA